MQWMCVQNTPATLQNVCHQPYLQFQGLLNIFISIVIPVLFCLRSGNCSQCDLAFVDRKSIFFYCILCRSHFQTSCPKCQIGSLLSATVTRKGKRGKWTDDHDDGTRKIPPTSPHFCVLFCGHFFMLLVWRNAVYIMLQYNIDYNVLLSGAQELRPCRDW